MLKKNFKIDFEKNIILNSFGKFQIILQDLLPEYVDNDKKGGWFSVFTEKTMKSYIIFVKKILVDMIIIRLVD